MDQRELYYIHHLHQKMARTARRHGLVLRRKTACIERSTVRALDQEAAVPARPKMGRWKGLKPIQHALIHDVH